MNFLKSIDLMGKQFSLNLKGEKQFKTALGGIITIFYLFIFLILFFLFGWNFYERKNPYFSFDAYQATDYFNYYVN